MCKFCFEEALFPSLSTQNIVLILADQQIQENHHLYLSSLTSSISTFFTSASGAVVVEVHHD